MKTIEAKKPNTGSLSATITVPALKYLSGNREWLAITLSYKTLGRFVQTSAVKKKNVEIIKSEIKNRFLDPKHKNDIKNYISVEKEFTIPPLTLVSYDRLPFIPITFNDDEIRPGETERDLLESRGSIMGLLQLPIDTEFECLDGNHRTAAIKDLAMENPELIAGSNMLLNIVYETRKQKIRQDFVDVNATAKQTSSSINTLFNTRDPLSLLVAETIDKISYLAETTELLATSVSKNSKDIYTINNVKNAIIELCGFNSQSGKPDKLSNLLMDKDIYEESEAKTQSFFLLLRNNRSIDSCIRYRDETQEIRNDSIITSGTGLVVAARVANTIFNNFDESLWEDELSKVFSFDWSRTNPLFRGSIIIGEGKILNSREAINTSALALKKYFNYNIYESEQESI